MAGKVALCVDQAILSNLELIGLGDEQLDSQEWLDVFMQGQQARCDAVAAGRYQEAWVVSCEDVEPINLAASLKADRPDMQVCLVTSDVCGSVLSRAHTAHIDNVLELGAFLRRYAEVKREMLNQPDRNALKALLPSAGEPSAGLGAAPAMEPVAMAAAAPAVLEPTVLERPAQVSSTSRFLEFQPQPALVPVRASNRAFVLTVVSGSGGAGKSAVSALGSLIARDRGHRTLLLDYDLQFGDVAAMVGADCPLCIDEALAHPDRLERELARDLPFMVLAAPARLETAEQVVRGLPALLERLAQAFEVVVVNTGSEWAEQHAALLERSSAALFLVDQRASSVRACNHALELCARCGIASSHFHFALNRCAKGAPLTSMDVSCALKGAVVFELRDGGQEVEDYLSGGAAEMLLESKNEFARSLEQLMERLLPSGARPTTKREEGGERTALRRRGRHADRRRSGRR